MTETIINFNIESQQPQFRIPTELIRKNFKSIQKLVEKQKAQLQADISSISSDKSLNRVEKAEILEKTIKSFEIFIKKLELKVKTDEEFKSRLSERLKNLQRVNDIRAKGSTDDGSGSISSADITTNMDLLNWYRDQINLLIIDYLLKSNVNEETNVGLQLIESLSNNSTTNFKKLIDFDIYITFNKIFNSVKQGHDLSLIIAWFQENKLFLKKTDSNLEFEINYSKFLNFIKTGKLQHALEFSRKHLAIYGKRTNYTSTNMINYERNNSRIQELGGFLLLIQLDPKHQLHENFKEKFVMLSNKRWEDLSSSFVSDFFRLYGITKNYPLFIYLSAGLSSLKTKACKCQQSNTIFNETRTDTDPHDSQTRDKLLNKINNCPVCSPELNEISSTLPHAQLITNIYDNPIKLPNGNIFNKEKLIQINSKMNYTTEGKIMDPITGEIYSYDDMVKMYPT